MLTEAWIEVDFGRVATLQRGYDLPHRLRRSGSVPVVTSTGVTDTHSEPRERAPGVITGRYGTIGEVFFVKQDYWPHNTTLFVRDFHGNDPLFVSYLLRTIDFKSHSGKSGVPGVNRNDLHALPVRIPPNLSEQRAIAEALNDVDELLYSLERLIAKKRDLKQAVMQQLLTGQTRLPGFEVMRRYKKTTVGVIPEDWDASKIDSIIDEISMGPFGSNITVSNFVSTGVPVLNGANVASERLSDSVSNYVSVAKAKSLKKAVANRGDIVVTHRGTIGQISYIPDNSAFYCYVVSQSQFRVRFSKDAVIPAWVVLYFHSELGSKVLLEGKGHTGVPAIAQPTTTFRNLSIPLPPRLEQTAIAEVLTEMDMELAALEQRRQKTLAIKQAMMQELLTGRTRLV